MDLHGDGKAGMSQRQRELGPRQRRLLEDGGRRQVDPVLQHARDDLHRRSLGRVRVDAAARHAAQDREVLRPHVAQLGVD